MELLSGNFENDEVNENNFGKTLSEMIGNMRKELSNEADNAKRLEIMQRVIDKCNGFLSKNSKMSNVLRDAVSGTLDLLKIEYGRVLAEMRSSIETEKPSKKDVLREKKEILSIEKAEKLVAKLLRCSQSFRKNYQPTEKTTEEYQEICNLWSKDMVDSIVLADIALTKENIVYVLTVRQMESGFRPQSGNGELIFKKVTEKFGTLYDRLERAVLMILPDEFEGKISHYKSEFLKCETEEDLYNWSQSIKKDLEDKSSENSLYHAVEKLKTTHRYSYLIKPLLSNLLNSYDSSLLENNEDTLETSIEYLTKKPATVGSYQVNIDILIRQASKDIANIASHPHWRKLLKGDKIDRDILIRSLFLHDDRDVNVLPRKVAEGFVLKYYVKPTMDINAQEGDGILTDKDVSFAALDFHAGAFACRNAAVQKALNSMVIDKALGVNEVVVDGDFCFYDKKGNPDLVRKSKTMQAIEIFASTLSEKERQSKTSEQYMREFVALSKSQELSSHPLWNILIESQKNPQRRAIPTAVTTKIADSELMGHKVTDAAYYQKWFTEIFQAHLDNVESV